MLLFRGRTARSQEAQEGSRRNSVSRTLFRCDCSADVSRARRALCRFPSPLKSTRWNRSAPPERPGSTRFSTPDSLRRFPQTLRESPPPGRVSVSFLYLGPLSPFRTPTYSQLQSLPEKPPARARLRRLFQKDCPNAYTASERQARDRGPRAGDNTPSSGLP